MSESYSYTLQQENPPAIFNLIARSSGTIADGLSLQANAQSGYWSGFNVNLLGEPNVPASCTLDANAVLSCSGHNLVTYPEDTPPTDPTQYVFYTAYTPASSFQTPVTCVEVSGYLQCTNVYGASVLQLVNWGYQGFPNTYMLGISTVLQPGNFPVQLQVHLV